MLFGLKNLFEAVIKMKKGKFPLTNQPTIASFFKKPQQLATKQVSNEATPKVSPKKRGEPSQISIKIVPVPPKAKPASSPKKLVKEQVPVRSSPRKKNVDTKLKDQTNAVSIVSSPSPAKKRTPKKENIQTAQPSAKTPKKRLFGSPGPKEATETSKPFQKNLVIFKSPEKPATKRLKIAKSPAKKRTPKKLEVEAYFEEDDAFFDVSFSPSKFSSLDLSRPHRCKVTEVRTEADKLILSLKSTVNGLEEKCELAHPWSGCGVTVGDMVSVRGRRSASGLWQVDRDGVFVHHADTLMTGTSVVGSLFCLRKSILSSLFKEPRGSTAGIMFVGSTVHELLQDVLVEDLKSLRDITSKCKNIIKGRNFIKTAYAEGLDIAETQREVEAFVPRVHEFMDTYRRSKPLTSLREGLWKGTITKVADIEDNVWCPELGLKGKIDATLEVKVGSVKKVVPMELKTGKASFNAEHRGQLILYCMMLSQMAERVDSGLLLYLKEVQMQEIKAGEAEQKDLLMLRNQVADWIRRTALPNLEGPPALPEPINHRSACSKCPFLPVCSSALREDGHDNLAESNPLKKLAKEATNHLSDEHIRYVFHWTALLLLEKARGQSQPFWTTPAEQREKAGDCIGDLIVTEKPSAQNGIFLHQLRKQFGVVKESSQIPPGTYVVMSTQDRLAVATGFMKEISGPSVSATLDKDISDMQGPFLMDRVQPSSTGPFSSLVSLFQDTQRAKQLRETVIDLKVPHFAKKLSSRIKKVGQDIFLRLNRDQNRAILQVLSADSYILVKGMPGTGKTATIVALIELLVRMGETVLVSCFTHSAVDNVLQGLVGKVDFMRLGSSSKVHPSIAPYTEEMLLEKDKPSTYEELDKFYKSKPVIGVTCLAASHFLLDKRSFDICLIDEATQVHQPTVLKPLFSAKKFVLIGDPEQLPPLVTDPVSKKEGYGVSLFQRLERPAVTSFLSLQYRMNQTITDLANKVTYDGALKCGTEAVANATLTFTNDKLDQLEPWLKKALSSSLEDSVVVLDVKDDTEGAERKLVNLKEATLVVQILAHLEKLGVEASEIGIISPYRAQVDHLSKLCKEIDERVEVNTVDQYQGRDKEVILYSCARSMDARENDILSDKNRLTVSITRAKVKLIILGNVDLLTGYAIFRRLFESIDSKHFVKITS